jgi:lysozyme
MLKPAVIDLSHHNVIPDNLVITKQSGIYGLIHKATEGTSYVDDKVENRFFLAKEAGMLWGLYHFVRPGSMEKQVDHFLAVATEVADDNTLFALDWEDPGVSLNDAVEFMQRLEEITEHSPVLYSGHVLKEALGGKADPRLSKYRLWLAQYTAGTPTIPPGWGNYWLWQYTDTGKIPGVTPPTDCNAYSGTAELLRYEWSGLPMPHPMPKPEPEEIITITVTVPPGVEVIVKREER